jgi:poly-gamma-glutamate synthesis protein (capsule biosynthesis protein)
LVLDIAGAQGSGTVIVAPHWGTTYRAQPSEGQRELARAWIEHGADLVVGSHSHVVGPVEAFGDGLAFYSLGNFIYDEDWSEETMEGLVLEVTLHGPDVVQARPRPVLIHDRSQPNLLEPSGGADDVLRRMERLSERLLQP